MLFLLLSKGIIVVYSQTIEKNFSQYIVCSDPGVVDTVSCLKYSIQNTLKSRIVVLFSQDELNDSIPIKRQMYRTLCRPYKNFRLSFYAWEAGLNGRSETTLVPQRFVKILDSGASFDIVFETKTTDLKHNPDYGLAHIQIIEEEALKVNGFKHFINGVKLHNAEYPYNYIVIRCEDFYNRFYYGEGHE